MTPTSYVLSGMILLAFSAAGVFFFRFRQRTGDRFFGFFGCAFWLLAIERVLLIWVFPNQEEKSYVYVVRLIAFLFILFAIADKNRKVQDQTPVENGGQTKTTIAPARKD